MSPNPIQKHLFYAEMAKLLEAGFGIREAADIMIGTAPPAPQARLLNDLLDGLEAGKTIADALGGNRDTVSDFERAIIIAGERGGRLAPALQHLADYFGMLVSSRREAAKGLVHPIVALHLGVFVGTVPTAMVAGDKSMTEAIASFVLTLLAAYALAFLVILGIRALLRAASENPGIDQTIRRIPLIGKARSDLAMAGFCKVYHTCLLAGIPMAETMRLAADASRSGLIRDAAKRLQKTLSEGNPLGPRFVAEPAFTKAFARSYVTGEAAGTLDKDLANWSRAFQTDAGKSVETLAAVIPKLLYFLILGYVAWQIVGFYRSYYGGMLKDLE